MGHGLYMLTNSIYIDKVTGISVSKIILEVERLVNDHIDKKTDIGIVTLTFFNKKIKIILMG